MTRIKLDKPIDKSIIDNLKVGDFVDIQLWEHIETMQLMSKYNDIMNFIYDNGTERLTVKCLNTGNAKTTIPVDIESLEKWDKHLKLDDTCKTTYGLPPHMDYDFRNHRPYYKDQSWFTKPNPNRTYVKILKTLEEQKQPILRSDLNKLVFGNRYTFKDNLKIYSRNLKEYNKLINQVKKHPSKVTSSSFRDTFDKRKRYLNRIRSCVFSYYNTIYARLRYAGLISYVDKKITIGPNWAAYKAKHNL